jgi:hypothetical protein
MTEPTDPEAQAFRTAVECIQLEARDLLEHLPPGEVLAALFVAAAAVAAEHRVGSAPLIQIFSKVLDMDRPRRAAGADE